MRTGGGRRLAAAGIIVGLALAAALVCLGAGLFSSGREAPPADPAGRQEEAMGIRFEHDDELRGRMVRVIARRAAETPEPADPQDADLQKLYDGALLCFAGAAREVWPDLDVSPLSDCLLFEGEVEKSTYTELAARLIGSVRIDKPEDITYWVNRETLAELRAKDGRP